MLTIKSKLLPLVIALLFAGSVYCQIPEVMVGDTGIISRYIQQPLPNEPWENGCGSQDFYLHKHSNNDFIYNVIQGRKSRPDSISWGHDPDIAEIYFAPKSKGINHDSTSFLSFWVCGARGHNISYFQDSVFQYFTSKGIDSIVVIKIKDTSIILPIDTQASKYKSKIEPFYFYSNIADSVVFDSWQLVIDPSARISFTVDSNTNALTEYTSKPFTRKKQLNFTFTTALPATDTAQSFPATMKTRVRYKGVDSVYSNNFTIILPAAPKSDVRNISASDLSLSINPNPFSKFTTFIVTTSNSEPVTLEIYDLLGNRKASIAAGEIINGIRDFHFDASGFAAGTYFARLVCGAQVFTRKIIIEK